MVETNPEGKVDMGNSEFTGGRPSDGVAKPDLELRVVQSLTKRLPRIRGMGRLMQLAGRVYFRKPRPRLISNVLGFEMVVDPDCGLQECLLLAPQLYDRREINYMLSRLRPGDCFVDVGAHIGLYALLASRRIGPAGRVLAVEACQETHSILNDNLRLNGIANVQVVNIAVSDSRGKATLQIAPENAGRNSLLQIANAARSVEVPCEPLGDLLEANGVTSVAGMKIDVEGMEYRILKHFFENAAPTLFPRFIILEHLEAFRAVAGGDATEVVPRHGYRLAMRTSMNCIYERLDRLPT